MSSTALKIIALIFMTADHIGRFIPGAPFFLRMAGRIAAPVFLFCSRWSFDKTSDRHSYLKRLYLFNLFTGIMVFVLNSMYPQCYYPVTGNIFTTIFTVLWYVWRTEKGEKEKLIFGFANLAGFALHCLLTQYNLTGLRPVTNALLPNFFTCEGGILIFVMGILFYYSKNDKELLSRNYLCYCGVYLALILFGNTYPVTTAPVSTVKLLFRSDIQWMQVMALPFILSYNGEKGRGMKWFFYIYYPLHTAVLFIAGNTMI